MSALAFRSTPKLVDLSQLVNGSDWHSPMSTQYILSRAMQDLISTAVNSPGFQEASSSPSPPHQAPSRAVQQRAPPSESGWGWPGNLLNLSDLAATTSNAMSVFGITESPRAAPQLGDAAEHNFFGLARIAPAFAEEPAASTQSGGDHTAQQDFLGMDQDSREAEKLTGQLLAEREAVRKAPSAAGEADGWVIPSLDLHTLACIMNHLMLTWAPIVHPAVSRNILHILSQWMHH